MKAFQAAAVLCLAATCFAISNLCNQCKCHLDLKAIYCNSDELIGKEDENLLKKFNLLILKNSVNSTHVNYLKALIKRVYEKDKEEERRAKCMKMHYTADMCLRNKPPPEAFSNNCTCE